MTTDIPRDLADEAVAIVKRLEDDVRIGRPVQIGRLFAAVGVLTELVDTLELRKVPA